jgi:hypothetical protein
MDRTQTPKPDLPLDVLEIVGKIEQQTRGTLESCVRGEFIVVGLILDMEKVTEIMQASATKSFRVRAEYYESQPGFCLEWLDEVVDETVAATLKLVPFRFLLSGYYKGGVRAIREGLETELRRILKLRVEAMQLRKASHSAPGVSEPPTSAGTTAQEAQPRQGRNGNKPVRRNQKYKTIDQALQKIAESRPRTQEEVFKALEGRVTFPPAEPFETARGWMLGFRRDKATARAWLSKRWGELGLAPLPRGPKNQKK